MYEAEVVHRLAQYGWCSPLGIEVGIAVSEGRWYPCGSPPAVFVVFGLAEGLIDHLHQVDGALIGHVLLNQRHLVSGGKDALHEAARQKTGRYIADHQPVETLPRFYLVLLRQQIAPMEADGMSRVYQV